MMCSSGISAVGGGGGNREHESAPDAPNGRWLASVKTEGSRGR